MRTVRAGFCSTGDPGIGKTCVWAAGVEASRERGMTVLAARPTGSEVRLSFAGLTDLVGRLPARAFASLPPPQQRALDAALLRADAPTHRTAARAVGQALLGVLRAVAAESPTVVAIDDLQWLDPPSGRALSFALRRLADEPVALLATARMDAHEAPPIDLERMFPDGRLRRVRVGPLSERRRRRAAACAARPQPVACRHSCACMSGPAEIRSSRSRSDVCSRVGGSRRHTNCRCRVRFASSCTSGSRGCRSKTRRVLLAAAGLSQPRLSLLGRTAASDLRPGGGGRDREGRPGCGVFAHPLLAFVPYEEAPPRSGVDPRASRAMVRDVEERARHLALVSVRAR